MPDLAMLDYFYGDEAEQFTFYRIPKVLFTDPSYRRISSDAKILYGLMLDRMGLSVRNGWLDEYNRVFIFFTLEDALEYLCCGHTKAVSLFGELDKAGLIERKKQGQGKPTKIYVKNFVRNAEVLTSEKRKSKVPHSVTPISLARSLTQYSFCIRCQRIRIRVWSPIALCNSDSCSNSAALGIA